MRAEKLIPGADEWWEKWKPVLSQAVAREGIQSAILWWVSLEENRNEVLDLLEHAAKRPQFWKLVRAEIDRVFSDPDALRRVLEEAQEGMAFAPTPDDVPKWGSLN